VRDVIADGDGCPLGVGSSCLSIHKLIVPNGAESVKASALVSALE